MISYGQFQQRMRQFGILPELNAICRRAMTTLPNAWSKSRSKRAVLGRHACWVYMASAGFSRPEIGVLWNTDQSTVTNGIQTVKDREHISTIPQAAIEHVLWTCSSFCLDNEPERKKLTELLLAALKEHLR